MKNEQYNAFKNLTTTVNDINISYNDVGKGTIPVIFLHGFPFDKSMWAGQLERLKDSNRVIAYDIRGFGQSTDEQTPLSMDLFADDLVSFMDQLDIDKAIICGLSMGGYIALNAMHRFPERFKALILCDTQCIADTPEVKTNRIKTIEQINAAGADAFNEKFVKSVFNPDTLTNKPQIVESLRNVVIANSNKVITAGLTALAERSETCSTLGKIIIPTLIICGREDEVTPLAQAEFMQQQIEGAMLKVIANAGHVSNLEQPDEFNQCLQQFLDILNATTLVEIPFEIDLGGIILTVQSLDTKDFLIYKGKTRVAIISPVRDGDVLTWSSREISTEYAEQIGTLVAAHEHL